MNCRQINDILMCFFLFMFTSAKWKLRFKKICQRIVLTFNRTMRTESSFLNQSIIDLTIMITIFIIECRISKSSSQKKFIFSFLTITMSKSWLMFFILRFRNQISWLCLLQTAFEIMFISAWWVWITNWKNERQFQKSDRSDYDANFICIFMTQLLFKTNLIFFLSTVVFASSKTYVIQMFNANMCL